MVSESSSPIRPDWVADDGSVSIEVKNIDLSTNHVGLIDNVYQQVSERAGLKKQLTMKNVGFHGGSSIRELGPSADVELFFQCLETCALNCHTEHNWSLLTDRLYRRYLKKRAREIFETMPSSSVNWQGLAAEPGKTRLNPDQPNLAVVFSKYFETFDYCADSAKVFFDSWKIYQPVRTVVSDLPDFMTDKKRSLDQYEALEGKPFWLR
jgi:hypothetical protein